MNENWFARFWGVIIRPQTYLNLVYLFLAFPLGVFYFVFLVTGLAVGFPLVIVWIGLLILALVFAAIWALTLFERQLAIWLLHVEIGPMGDEADPNADAWQRFKGYITNPVTWKGLLFLLLKFPMGILSFSVGTALLAASLGLIFSPLILIFFPKAEIYFFNVPVHPALGGLIAFILGVLLVPISLHILNGLAYVYGQAARLLLGRVEPRFAVAPTAPVAPVAPAAPQMTPAEPPAPAEPAAPQPPTTAEIDTLFPSEPESPAAEEPKPEPPAQS